MEDLVKGPYRVKNPHKYKGNPANVIFRSSWELKVMRSLDSDPSVIHWSSEEIRIPYRSPKDGRVHTYYPDFFVKKKDGTYILEVKPYKEAVPPKVATRRTKKYLNEVVTYGVNQAKWKAAERYCEERGWRFQVLTEHELGLTKR